MELLIRVFLHSRDIQLELLDVLLAEEKLSLKITHLTQLLLIDIYGAFILLQLDDLLFSLF